MTHCLEASNVEGAAILILPTSFLQPISCPYSVLKKKPYEEFAFGRCPNTPSKGRDYVALKM
jgi:hypothetical protein